MLDQRPTIIVSFHSILRYEKKINLRVIAGETRGKLPECYTWSSEQVLSYSQFVVSVPVSVDLTGGVIVLSSGGSGVRRTSKSGIAFVSSDIELQYALLFSFCIAPTLVLTVIEHHSSELPSDYGLSG